MSASDDLRPKSKWVEINPTFVSSDSKLDTVRIMRVVETYVVARRTGCAPFVVPVREWHKRFRALTGGKDG